MRRRRPRAVRLLLGALAATIPAALAAWVVLGLTDGGPSRDRVAVELGDGTSSGGSAGGRVIIGHEKARIESEIEPLGRRPPPPSEIRFPAIGVDAEVVSVGAAADGIRVPGVYEAGWYRLGPRPGEPGRAIIIGHLDSKTGPAVFTELTELEPGDPVEVLGGGKQHDFVVDGSLEIEKSRFPAEQIYAASKRPELVLITCGGDFDERTGYEDNLVVFAH